MFLDGGLALHIHVLCYTIMSLFLFNMDHESVKNVCFSMSIPFSSIPAMIDFVLQSISIHVQAKSPTVFRKEFLYLLYMYIHKWLRFVEFWFLVHTHIQRWLISILLLSLVFAYWDAMDYYIVLSYYVCCKKQDGPAHGLAWLKHSTE